MIAPMSEFKGLNTNIWVSIVSLNPDLNPDPDPDPKP